MPDAARAFFRRALHLATWVLGAVTLLAGCASQRPPVTGGTPAVSCNELAAQFSWPGLRIGSAEPVPDGAVKVPGIAQPMPAHCLVKGAMNERTGPVDGRPYAIGFEMRLPTAWNGRFFYQANGGLDGFVTPAYGDILGGGPPTNGLLQGFAVISSDAGHVFDRSTPIGGGSFGLDPQARRDGYNAVAQFTPMAKALVARYYGKAPMRSYLVGTLQRRPPRLRHGLASAGRLRRHPGHRARLQPAARRRGAGRQQLLAPLAHKSDKTGLPDSTTAVPPASVALVAQAVLRRCDALDGLADGWIGDLVARQRALDAPRRAQLPALPRRIACQRRQKEPAHCSPGRTRPAAKPSMRRWPGTPALPARAGPSGSRNTASARAMRWRWPTCSPPRRLRPKWSPAAAAR